MPADIRRSAATTAEKGQHRGVLVVDRYAGYSPAWLGRMQYCFEHLKRDGKDILEKGVKDASGRSLPMDCAYARRFSRQWTRCDCGGKTRSRS